MMLRTLSLFLVASAASAWSTPTTSTSVGRREVMGTIAAGAFFAPVANALEACSSTDKNCVQKTWIPPSGSSKKDAILSLRAVLLEIPKTGQAGLDGGGWTLAEDNLKSKGTARVAYKSKGSFSKKRQPFTDDLIVEVKDNGTIMLQSSSRAGDGDFGVVKRVRMVM